MATVSDTYDEYLSALLGGRRIACRDAVQRLLDDGASMRDIYVSLFQRSLYDVGRLWESNRISVACEHLATAITESLMPMVYPAVFASQRVGRSAVISCVANEHHQIGGKMVADVLELNGWDGYFLGANTPIGDLLDMIEDKAPEMVGLSLSVYFNMDRLVEAVEAIGKRFPDQRILVGGHAFSLARPDSIEALGRVEYIPSLQDLEAIVRPAE